MALTNKESFNKYMREYARKRRASDPEYRERENIRNRSNYKKNGAHWPCNSREAKRESKFKSVFGITTVRYNEMLALQNGVCRACGRPPNKKLLAIDHCHKTGKIRGLLCTSCNLVVGWIENNPGRIKQAEDYIERTNHEEISFGVIP